MGTYQLRFSRDELSLLLQALSSLQAQQSLPALYDSLHECLTSIIHHDALPASLPSPLLGYGNFSEHEFHYNTVSFLYW